MKQVLVVLLGLLLLSCTKTVVEHNHIETSIIGHKGSGSNGEGLGLERENTIKACKIGFKRANGIEIDIQRTNDGEIFLYHDFFVTPCADFDIKSVAASTKNEVYNHFKCLFAEDSISTLSEVLELQQTYHPKKHIFLDVKAVINANTLIKMPMPQHYLNLLSQDIFREIEDFQNKGFLHIETENAVMLNAFKKHYPKVNTWLTSYGDFNTAIRRASKENYTGISIQDGKYITEKSISEAHKKGLQVSVWTVNDKERIEELIQFKVDFIQTDKL